MIARGASYSVMAGLVPATHVGVRDDML